MSDTLDFIAKGYPFRLYSSYCGKYIFPRSHTEKDGTRHVEAHADRSDRTGLYAKKEGNLYRIYSLAYGSTPQWMFISGDRKGGSRLVEMGSNYGSDPRGLFRIDDRGNGDVRLYSDGLYVFPSGDKDDGDNILEAHESAEDRTSWTVEFIDATYELSNVKYDMSKLTHADQPPLDMGTQRSENNTSVTQTPTLTFTNTATVARSFTASESMKAGWTTKISAGVPGVGSTEESFSMELSATFSWGTTAQNSQSVTVTFPVSVPPHTTVEGTAAFKQAKVNVPYTADVVATFNDPQRTVLRYSINGTYSGINAYDLETRYDEV